MPGLHQNIPSTEACLLSCLHHTHPADLPVPHPPCLHHSHSQVDKYKKAAADAEAVLVARDQAVKEISRQGSAVDRERKAAEAEVR